jgi:single-stranded-DNA-specific exonuclease
MAEIKNITQAARRLLSAVSNKERIVLYGDSDPDGVSSVLIMEEAIQLLGGEKPVTYFPDRETEGYGINKRALRILKKYAPALFITFDCGITNAKEVEIAKKMGFTVMIVDHHEMPQIIPQALIVNPKQKGDRYPFKFFAGAGLAYKLAQKMFSLARKSYAPERFLGLVALATIADQMPLEQDNEKLVREGLAALPYTKREVLRALMKLTGFSPSEGAGQFRQKMLPPLTIWRAKRHKNPLYSFLKEQSPKKAQNIAKALLQDAEKKKEIMRKIFEEADGRVAFSKEPIIFEGDTSWPLIFTGAIASRLCNKYKKPVFLYRKSKRESVGAVRTPQGLNCVKAMERCRKLLLTYGGHPAAGGFRAKTKDLEKLRACLTMYFRDLDVSPSNS